MARQPVTPEDLIASGTAAHDALAHLTDSQWTEKPPKMDWTRLITGSHICGALQFYATQLATGSIQYTATIRIDESALKGAEMPELVKSEAVLLAAVARGSREDTRAWHPTGSPDVEGFLAIGCAEVVLHCWDAVQDTGIEFAADEALADRLLRRIFPWSPIDTPRWQTLLFATGRSELEGHDSPGDRWMWHCPPLDEWNGEEPRSDRWVRKS